jgi:hypothetical protein
MNEFSEPRCISCDSDILSIQALNAAKNEFYKCDGWKWMINNIKCSITLISEIGEDIEEFDCIVKRHPKVTNSYKFHISYKSDKDRMIDINESPP